MSNQITTAFVQQYRAAIDLIVQQIESRFRDKVQIEPIRGEKAFVDFIGKLEPVQRTTRHGDTKYSETPHSRRMIVAAPYDLADLIDEPDQVRMLVDPTNKYLQAFRAGFERVIDRLIIQAALGTAYAGVSGQTAITFPASQQIAANNAGLTVDKLIKAAALFMQNEVPEDWDRWCAVTARQIQDLLNETKVGSADYNELRPLYEGKIVKFMGFNFVHSELLPKDASNNRRVICWVKPGIALGINYDVTSHVDVLPTKNYSTQVFMSMMLGATRLQEECVVEIKCVES